MEDINKWHRRFIDLAAFISNWSKDPSSKVGAVIVDDKMRIVSTGYNGFPRGLKDSEDRLNDRDVKYFLMIHAEENAILSAGRDLSGCSIYISPFPPCTHCATLILQSGLKDVYCRAGDLPDRWRNNICRSFEILKEGGVNLHFV